MPAPKREPSPHDSEPTMTTADEDGEDLHSNSSPASHINSLKRRTHPESTTPPRTKMKLCSSLDTEDNQPAKSPTPSFSADDSSSSVSDPPVKKAKLLIATSASSGEDSSPNTISKGSLKRAASTDSEDELSSDDSKADIFRDKGDGEKTRCIRKYANRVKGKRRTEEAPSVPQERSHVSLSAPTGMIKMDHNYGRFSDLLGFGDTNLDVRKENVTSVTKGERQELLIPSVPFEPAKTLCSSTLSTQTSIEIKKCATSEEGKPDGMRNVENPKPIDNTSVTSCREDFDSAAAMQSDQVTSEASNEKTEHIEAVDSQECAPNESQGSVAKTVDSGPRDTIQVGSSHSDGRTDFSCASQTEVSRETETQEKTEIVFEEINTGVKSSDAEAECEELEETAIPAVQINIEIHDKASSNDTDSEPQKIPVESNVPSQTEVNLTSCLNTRVESSVVLEEDSKCGQATAGLILETTLVNTDLPQQIVSQPEENIEESERNGSVALSTSSAEVQLSLVVVDETSAGYPEIIAKDCTAGDEHNQRPLPCNDTTLELKTETCVNTEQTPEPMSYLPQKQHEQNYRSDEGASEVKEQETTNFESTTGPNVPIELVEEPSEMVFKEPPAESLDKPSVFTGDHGAHLDTVEIQDEVDLENTTARERVTSQTKVPSPAPAKEVQRHNGPAVCEPVTDIPTEEHPNLITEVEKTEGTDGLRGVCTSTQNDLDELCTVQIQQHPETTEGTECPSEEMQNPQFPGCFSSNSVGSAAADVQERMTSDDFSSGTVAAESENQQSQDSADKDHECPESRTAEGNEIENAFLPESYISAESCEDVETTAAAASAESSGVTDPVMVNVQTNEEMSEVPSHDESQADLSFSNGENSRNDTVATCMDVTNGDDQAVEDVKSLVEEMDLPKPSFENQDVQEMVDLNFEAREEPKAESGETKEVNSVLSSESADNVAAPTRMESYSTPCTSEVTSVAPPAAEVQTQATSEVPCVDVDVINKSSGKSPDENKLCAEAFYISGESVGLDTAETIESFKVPSTVEAMNKNDVDEHSGTESVGGRGDDTPKDDITTAEHVEVLMDTTPAPPEEFPEAPVIDVCSSLETTELSATAEENLLSPGCEGTVEPKASAPECLNRSEAPMSLGSDARQKIISDPPPATEEEIHKVPDISEPNTGTESCSTEAETGKDELAAESVDTSESQTNAECTPVPILGGDVAAVEMEEVSENEVVLSDEIHTVLPAAAAQGEEEEAVQQVSSAEPLQVDTQPISPSIECKDYKLEVETVIDETAAVSANKPEDTSHPGAPEEKEDFAIARQSTEDSKFSILPSAEQKETDGLLEVQTGESQVVYEPISSPESNAGDVETPVASNDHEAESHTEIQNMAPQKTEEETRDVCTHVENLEIVPTSSTETEVLLEVAPESCVAANTEQDGTIADVTQAAVTGSGPDCSAPGEGEVDGSESNGFPHFASAAEHPEQDVDGLQRDSGDAAVTAANDALAMEDGDAEFVTLEPVPQSEIDFDIVTQAAAESGLSVSYAEEIFHGDASMVTAENKEILNGSQLVEQVQECRVIDEVQREENQPPDHYAEEAASRKFENGEEEREEVTMDVDGSTNSTAGEVVTSEDVNLVTSTHVEADVPVQEVQVLQDMELGHEIVVGITEDEGGDDVCVVEKPLQTSVAKAEEKNGAEKSQSGEAAKPDKKPKKQEMNTQARTKARLAALAEQKAAAASKRSANKQQLNLLALCQEIAEDIATDSMLLQRIEEEKKAAAAAAAAIAAAAAAKSQAVKDEPPTTSTQEPDAAAATPAAPAADAPPPTPAVEAAAVQPLASEPGETKKEVAAGAEEPPKRRFFVSQVSVPLKAHEKKKLTRYQRLRQVELQREKMSWARVKKLKSDQASQASSDMDWQAPLHAFSQFSMGPAAVAETPVPVPPAPAPQTSPPSEPVADSPKVSDDGVKQTESPKVEAAASEASTATADAAEKEPPVTETRKSLRQIRAQAAKEAPPAAPAPKATRSASKRSLPAVPPPMPNGVGARKQKPVEYTPYKPRPKYTFADFELDDDPVPAPPVRPGPPARTPQQTPRPPAQGIPTGQLRPAPVPPKLPGRTPPPSGQVSAQSRPTAKVALQPQQRPSASQTPQSKAVVSQPSPTHLRQATPTAPRPATSSASTTAGASSSSSGSSSSKGTKVTNHLSCSVTAAASC